MQKGQPKKKEEDKCGVIAISVPKVLINEIDQIIEDYQVHVSRSRLIVSLINTGLKEWRT